VPPWERNKPERETVLEEVWICACLSYLQFSVETRGGSNFASAVAEFPHFAVVIQISSMPVQDVHLVH